jgi:Flp pilus assembly pilin Flp
MLRLSLLLRRYTHDTKGGALVEYAVIFAVLAGLTVGVMTALGGALEDVFTAISGALTTIGAGIP